MREATINKMIRDEVVPFIQIETLGKIGYLQATEKFTYNAVRDTLVKLGTKLHRARQLASENRGDIRKRLKCCLSEIKQRGH